MNLAEPNYHRIKVTPRARKQGVLSTLEDGTIKVGVHAVAEKGKANQAVIEVLAEHFGIKQNQVHIISGHTDSIKLIRIT